MVTFVQPPIPPAEFWRRRLGVRIVLALGCFTILATSKFVPPQLTEEVEVDVSPDQPNVHYVVRLNEVALEQTARASLAIDVLTDQVGRFEVDLAGAPLNPKQTRLVVAPAGDVAFGGSDDAAAGSFALPARALAPNSADSIRDAGPDIEVPGAFAHTSVELSLDSCEPDRACVLEFDAVVSGWTTDRLHLKVSVTLDHTTYTNCSGWQDADEYSKAAVLSVTVDD